MSEPGAQSSPRDSYSNPREAFWVTSFPTGSPRTELAWGEGSYSHPGLSRWREEEAQRASWEGERRCGVRRHLFGLKTCHIQIPVCLVSLLKVSCSCPKTSLGKYFSDFPTLRGPQDLPGPLPGTFATPSVHRPDAALLPHLPFPSLGSPAFPSLSLPSDKSSPHALGQEPPSKHSPRALPGEGMSTAGIWFARGVFQGLA